MKRKTFCVYVLLCFAFVGLLGFLAWRYFLPVQPFEEPSDEAESNRENGEFARLPLPPKSEPLPARPTVEQVVSLLRSEDRVRFGYPPFKYFITQDNRVAVLNILRLCVTDPVGTRGTGMRLENQFMAAMRLSELSDDPADLPLLKGIFQDVRADGKDFARVPAASEGFSEQELLWNRKEGDRLLVSYATLTMGFYADLGRRLNREAEVLPVLWEKTESPQYDLWSGAMEAIGKLKSPEALRSVIEHLRSVEDQLPKPWPAGMVKKDPETEEEWQHRPITTRVQAFFGIFRTMDTRESRAAARQALDRLSAMYQNDPHGKEALAMIDYDWWRRHFGPAEK